MLYFKPLGVCTVYLSEAVTCLNRIIQKFIEFDTFILKHSHVAERAVISISQKSSRGMEALSSLSPHRTRALPHNHPCSQGCWHAPPGRFTQSQPSSWPVPRYSSVNSTEVDLFYWLVQMWSKRSFTPQSGLKTMKHTQTTFPVGLVGLKSYISSLRLSWPQEPPSKGTSWCLLLSLVFQT